MSLDDQQDRMALDEEEKGGDGLQDRCSGSHPASSRSESKSLDDTGDVEMMLTTDEDEKALCSCGDATTTTASTCWSSISGTDCSTGEGGSSLPPDEVLRLDDWSILFDFDWERDDPIFPFLPVVPTVPNSSTSIEKTDLDVLMGRGGEVNHHPGNLRYRQYVMICQPQYHKLTTHATKQALRDHVYNWVTQDVGGRFLWKPSGLTKSNEGWAVAPVEKVKAKISQALREEWILKPKKKAQQKARLPARQGTRSCCSYVWFMRGWDNNEKATSPP